MELTPSPKGFIRVTPHNQKKNGPAIYLNISNITGYSPADDTEDSTFVFTLQGDPLMVKESIVQIGKLIDHDHLIKGRK